MGGRCDDGLLDRRPERELVTSVLRPGTLRMCRGLMTHVGDGVFEHPVVGSDRGAVSAFRPVRFPGPPSEPDVRLSPHRALHVSTPADYATSCVLVAHGEAMAAPR